MEAQWMMILVQPNHALVTKADCVVLASSLKKEENGVDFDEHAVLWASPEPRK